MNGIIAFVDDSIYFYEKKKKTTKVAMRTIYGSKEFKDQYRAQAMLDSNTPTAPAFAINIPQAQSLYTWIICYYTARSAFFQLIHIEK